MSTSIDSDSMALYTDSNESVLVASKVVGQVIVDKVIEIPEEILQLFQTEVIVGFDAFKSECIECQNSVDHVIDQVGDVLWLGGIFSRSSHSILSLYNGKDWGK